MFMLMGLDTMPNKHNARTNENIFLAEEKLNARSTNPLEIRCFGNAHHHFIDVANRWCARFAERSSCCCDCRLRQNHK